MPNLNVGLVLAVFIGGGAWGLTIIDGPGVTPQLCYDIPSQYAGEGCADGLVDSCGDMCESCNNKPATEAISGGVRAKTTYKTTVTGLVGAQDANGNWINGCDLSCSCVGTSTFTCISGYYGTATGLNAGCTACPANATCAGGNGSTFVCNEGYRKSGTSCFKCGANQTSNEDRTACVCIDGYYLFKSSCVACPANTLTCGPGTTVYCMGGYYRAMGTSGFSCNRCPAIVDSDTGYAIYRNSGLSTVAYGTSTNATSISGCYWMQGTWYDQTGTIAIGAGAAATTCAYSSN